jgi:ubiquinol-cytochrome c reductase cytochrome b subunit
LVLLLTVSLFREHPSTDPAISMRRWEWHHRTRLGLLMAVIVGAVFLTATSVVGTEGKPEFKRAVTLAHADADRAVQLADQGIPVEGAVSLLRNDPKTQGPRLFAAQCAACHSFEGKDGMGGALTAAPSAPDLAGIASREWIAGMLDPKRVDSEKYFGPQMQAHTGKMVRYVQQDVAEYDEKERAQLVKVVKALSAEAHLRSQATKDAADAAEVAEGFVLIGDAGVACTDCHTFHEEKGKGGPDLTGYGSREWLAGIIANPEHPRFYGKNNDRMPAFGKQGRLNHVQIGLLVDWLRGEWYEPGANGSPTTKPTTRATTRPRPRSTSHPATVPTTQPTKRPATGPASQPVGPS